MRWVGRVTRRYQLKHEQFEADNRRLQELVAEHDAITKQLGYESNAAERLRLERQQDDYRERMDKLALRCDRLQNELQVLEAEENALQALIALLTPISSEIVAKAYQSCTSEGRLRPAPETLAMLLQQLAEIPGEAEISGKKGELKPLFRFVSILTQERSLQPNQRQALQRWAEAQGVLPVASVLVETTETCLMIKVQPRSFNDPALGYLVSAAISQDPDPLNPEVKPITTPITIPEGVDPKCAPGYGKDELPCVLSKLIATCGGKLHRIPLGDLTVQWFLPIELMSLPIEHWQIQIGRSQQPCSGERCKAVIVRSYDRHFPPYSDAYESVLGDWENAWRRLSSCFHTHCDQALYPLNPMARKTAIDWNNPEVVGCWFIEHTDQQQQEDFWDNLLVQGSPIAFWSRQSESVAATTMQSVRNCSVSELPLSLTRQRQTALRIAIEADRLKAAPLCLLFDNPFRPFPTLDYQSA